MCRQFIQFTKIFCNYSISPKNLEFRILRLRVLRVSQFPKFEMFAYSPYLCCRVECLSGWPRRSRGAGQSPLPRGSSSSRYSSAQSQTSRSSTSRPSSSRTGVFFKILVFHYIYKKHPHKKAVIYVVKIIFQVSIG